MESRKRRIVLGSLVVVHVVGVTVAAWLSEMLGISVSSIVAIAIVFGLSGLLGVWLAFGRGKLWKIVGAVLVATLYVGGLGQLSFFGDASIVVFFVPPIALVAFGLALIHRKGLRISLVSASASASAVEGLQFSIRHILGCTALVAVLLTVVRGIREFEAEHTGFAMGLFLWAIVGLSVVILVLASVWASLGVGRPTQRFLVVLMIVVLVGLMQIYFFGPRLDVAKFIAWIAMNALIAAIINGNLLVLRSCGYRLVRST